MIERQFIEQFAPDEWECFGQGDSHGAFMRVWEREAAGGYQIVLAISPKDNSLSLYVVEIAIGGDSPSFGPLWVWRKEGLREDIMSPEFAGEVWQRLGDAECLFGILSAEDLNHLVENSSADD